MKKLIFFLSITLTLSTFAQVPNYVPTNGLVGWWPFDGNANDESGNGNNGTVNGATLTADRFGNSNSAYYFDGVNDDISVDRNILSSFTTSTWFFTNQNAAIMPFLDANNANWEIYLNNLRPTFTPWVSMPNIYTEYISTNLSTQNLWNNLVCTFDGNNIKFYLNGSLIDIFQNVFITINTNGLFYFGSSISGSAQYYDGILDDIGIWNRALTQCEIQDLYNAQLNSGSGINAGVDQTVCQGNAVTLTGSGGSNYQWNNGLSNGVSFTPLTTQDYILSGEDVNGCLGTDTVTIEVLPNSSSFETVTECNSFTWGANNQTYTSSGQYTEVLTNAVGCDSTVTLDLTITQPTTGSETITECNSFTWGANNQTYTATGQYTEVLTNAVGCDSTVTLDLTITQPTTGSETITECNSFTWGANNQTYTASGQYTEVLTNAVGCDSTVTLDLTITQPTTGSETITECNSFTWGANNQTYTATGQYTAVLTNAVGCDSTVTLDLTITQPTTGSETITECNSFTWGANNQTYTSSGQYTEVLTNAVGCDSTVTLDLTINSVDNGITQVDDFTLQANATGASYQWIDCADESVVVGATNQQFAPAENGDYAVIVTQNGCSDTTECLSVSRLSILEHEQTLLVVYPNPATSMITIENPQGIASNYVVIDAQGRQVNAGKLQGETTSIDVAHIANGMYTITFEKNNLKDIKFIKK